MNLIRKSPLAVLTLFALLGAAGCDSTSEPQFEGPPPLPPLQSLNADISFFLNAVEAGGTENPPGAHFQFATELVTSARTNTAGSLAFLVAILDGAATIQPSSESGRYHWRYVTTVPGHSFDSDLSGRARGITDAVWELRVTSATHSPSLNGFLWASGTASLLNEFGEWRINDPAAPSGNTQIVRIGWTRTGDSYRAVFTNMRAGVPENGDYLDYESASFTRRITYLDKSNNSTAFVQWNPSTNAGHVTSAAYNGGQRACWGSNFQNTPCS